MKVEDINISIRIVFRLCRGGSRVSGKGVHMYKVVGVALLILSHLFLISHENEIIWSHRPNDLIFVAYVNTRGGEERGGGSVEPPEPPLDPPL